jgi:hypothetical protein
VGHLHGGTASGVRSQNREIKYKNPLSSLRRKAPWPRSRTVRRLAMRASGRLKTFGLVFALPFVERPPLEEGGGTINPWRLWAALPHGVSRRDFFSWRWRFDYFSRNQSIQTALRLRSEDKWSHCKHLDGALCSVRLCGSGFAGIYFPSLFESPRGWSKLWDSQAGTVGQARTHFPRNCEMFFLLPGASRRRNSVRGICREIAAKFRWGGSSATNGNMK